MRIRVSLACVLFASSGGLWACSSSDDGGSGASDGGSAGIAGSAGHSSSGMSGSSGASTAGFAGTASGGSAGANASGSGGMPSHAGSSGNGGAAGSGGSSAGISGAGAGGGGGAGGNSGASAGGSGGAAPFALTSSSFSAMNGCSKDAVSACDQFPKDMWLTTIGGANHSPELTWTPGPASTLSYALVLHDDSNDYTHWAVWNIPASVSALPGSLANGPSPNGLTGVQQVSFFDQGKGYAGPGAHSHVYQFKLYALKVASISPTLPGSNPQAAVRNLLESSADVLATTDLRGATAP